MGLCHCREGSRAKALDKPASETLVSEKADVTIDDRFPRERATSPVYDKLPDFIYEIDSVKLVFQLH